MTNTNATQNTVSSFAKAMDAALSASNNVEAKGAALVVAMCESVTGFTLSDCHTYFGKVANRQASAALRDILSEMSPSYVASLEDSRIDMKIVPEKQIDTMADRKVAGTNACRKMETLLREAFIALYWLRSIEADEVSIVKGKIDFNRPLLDKEGNAVLDKKGNAKVENKTMPVSECRRLGNKMLQDKGLKTAPVEKASTDDAKAKAKEMVASLAKDGFAEICNTLCNMIKAKDLDKASESEVQSLTKLNELLVFSFFGNQETGEVDIKTLVDAFTPNNVEDDRKVA